MKHTYPVALAPEVLKKVSFEPNGCWLWQGSVSGRGYPYAQVEGKQEYISIYIYERLVSELPKRTHLWRRCKNILCVCPEHMNPGKPVSGAPLSPFTTTFDKTEKMFKTQHEDYPNAPGWGETADEAMFDCFSEIDWHGWLG